MGVVVDRTGVEVEDEVQEEEVRRGHLHSDTMYSSRFTAMSGIATAAKESSDDVDKRTEGAAGKDVKPLLIAGGLSTRMGSPKHLLLFPDGKPLYQHTLEHLHYAYPFAETLYISLREKSQWESLNAAVSKSGLLRVQPIYDGAIGPGLTSNPSIGPAAGLLSAYAFSPTTTWLVAGFDYPLLTAGALQELL